MGETLFSVSYDATAHSLWTKGNRRVAFGAAPGPGEEEEQLPATHSWSREEPRSTGMHPCQRPVLFSHLRRVEFEGVIRGVKQLGHIKQAAYLYYWMIPSFPAGETPHKFPFRGCYACETALDPGFRVTPFNLHSSY